MSAVDQLWAALDDCATARERFAHLLVLSDAYRDAGDDARADALAWAVREGKEPDMEYNRKFGQIAWWYAGALIKHPASSELPEGRFGCLRGAGIYWKNEVGRAYRDLVEALVRAGLPAGA